jgi:HEAT repeats
VPSLRLILPLSDPGAVAAAVDALAMIGRPAEAAVPELEALAAKSPLQLQLACAAALSCVTGDPERGLPILLKALGDSDPLVRKAAVEKIAGLGEVAHPAIPNLLRCTFDPDDAVRAAAVLTLGRIRAPHAQSVPEATLRLNDTSAEVRYAAAVVLASYGENARSSLTALHACLQDPVEKVAKCSAGAIKKIESPDS